MAGQRRRNRLARFADCRGRSSARSDHRARPRAVPIDICKGHVVALPTETGQKTINVYSYGDSGLYVTNNLKVCC
jgi:hypothetical protein